MRVFSRSAMALAVAGLLVGPGAALAHDRGQQQGQGSASEGYGRGQQGPHHGNVRDIQERLKDMGYDPGPIDGAMGPRTHAALKQFQQAQNLPVTGRPDPQTLSALKVSDTGTSGTAGTRGAPAERPGSETEPGTGSQPRQGTPAEGGGTQGYRGGAGNEPQ